MLKVAMAYSGILDDDICIHWLKHVKNAQVFTFTANLGQLEHLLPITEKALSLGATAAHIADLREKFIKEFVFPTLSAMAGSHTGYFLSPALARPLITEEIIKIARDEGCNYIAHGSYKTDNDYIRFHRYIQKLGPELKIITPLTEMNISSRDEAIDYAKRHGIEFESASSVPSNIEKNIWGVNISKTQGEAPYLTVTPINDTPARPVEIEIGFREGLPVSLDDKNISGVKLVEQITKIAGAHGIGRYEIIEDSISGIKTVEIYEAPASTVLYRAREELERVILDKDTLHFKQGLSNKYAQLVYEGLWFSPLREALNEFFQRLNKQITGKVKMSLFKANIEVTARKVNI